MFRLYNFQVRRLNLSYFCSLMLHNDAERKMKSGTSYINNAECSNKHNFFVYDT
jgi:hypothetical protein